MGDLTTNASTHRFRLKNIDSPNSYNAATFVSRIARHGASNGDLMATNLVPYGGDFDVILVAKFDITPISNRESFFSTAPGVTGFQVGIGAAGHATCKNDIFSLLFDDRTLCGDASKRVQFDTEFHRYRIKWTDKYGNRKWSCRILY